MTISLLLMAGAAAGLTPDERAVSELDRRYQQAVEDNDAATVDAILHPQFTLVLGDGSRHDRERLIDNARTRKFIYDQQDEENGTQQVVVVGDTAVVTAKLLLKARTQDGQVIERKLWFSDTYVRTREGWKYLFGQASLPLNEAPVR